MGNKTVIDRGDIVTTIFEVDNPKGKIKTVTINAPKDEKIFLKNYAYGLHLIFKDHPDVLLEATKIAEEKIEKGEWY